MNDSLQSKITSQQLENKRDAFTRASQNMEKMNFESRSLVSKYLDGILFYSAGGFSFTVALIGLISESKIQSLAHIGIIFPNIYWLYGCWLFFISACIFSLLSRKLDSYYTGYFGSENYTEAYMNFEKAAYDYMCKYPDTIHFVKPLNEQKKIYEYNIKLLEEANKKNKKSKDFWYRIMRIANISAEICALLGVILLMLFSIQLTQSLIWKS